jgi:adenosylhomocysteine nucleosidase
LNPSRDRNVPESGLASHVADYVKHIAIFTATRWEFDAVRRAFILDGRRGLGQTRCFLGHWENLGIWLVQTGIGLRAASVAVRAVMAVQQFDLLVSSGFSGALTQAAIGELLIGTEVVSYPADAGPLLTSEPCLCSRDAGELAMRSARSAGVSAQAGRIVTVSRILWRASEKRAVGEATGAIGSDMESSVICAAAREHHASALVARSVSDRHDEELPLDFNRFLGPAGWLTGSMHCLAHPASVRGLYRLRSQAQVGAGRLTRFFEQFFRDLSRSGQPLLR